MSPRLLHTIEETRTVLAGLRTGGNVGLVPTMGALHAGHGSLIEQARRESDPVVVSIFVNPIQFDRADDYERYPQTLEGDLEFCRRLGVDLVFAPSAGEMYPHPPRTFVEVAGLTEHLCGRFRPGHFRGVATVVAKLFHIVQPNRAYFGEKDWQQLAVIRRLVADLDLPIAIVGVPTVREPDGLALSSRNRRLSPEERRAAPLLYQALLAAQRSMAEGAGPDEAKSRALAVLAGSPEMKLEYLEIVDQNLQPVVRPEDAGRIAAAVWLGVTRLIDNVPARPGEPPR